MQLWKRRWVEIDALGNLVLSPSKHNEKGIVKRFHLSDFRTPYPPDQDRQELPNSVVLDFMDGRTLQCACETYIGQAQVLQSKFQPCRCLCQLLTSVQSCGRRTMPGLRTTKRCEQSPRLLPNPSPQRLHSPFLSAFLCDDVRLQHQASPFPCCVGYKTVLNWGCISLLAYFRPATLFSFYLISFPYPFELGEAIWQAWSSFFFLFCL